MRRRGDDLELVVGGGYHFSSFTPNGSRYVASLSQSAAAWRRTSHEDAPPAGFSASDALASNGSVRCFARYGNGERTEGPAWDAVDAPPQVAAAGAATVYDALWTLDEDGWRRRPLAGPRPTRSARTRRSLRSGSGAAKFWSSSAASRPTCGGPSAASTPSTSRAAPGRRCSRETTSRRSARQRPSAPRRRRRRTARRRPEHARPRGARARGARTPTAAIAPSVGELQRTRRSPRATSHSEVEFDADAAPELPPAADQARLAALGLRGATRPAERWEPEVAPRRKRGPRRKRARAAPTAPSPRAGHSCTRVGRELVVLCGLGRVEGQSGLPRSDYLDEAWFLSFDGATGAARWRLPRVQGRPPGGRAGHAAAAVGPHVVVFGGVNAPAAWATCTSSTRPRADLVRAAAGRPGRRAAHAARARRRARRCRRRGRRALVNASGGTRAWGAAAAVATATQRHAGDTFAVVARRAPVAEMKRGRP